ncbi:Mov34/MPN/PAD-1 family protein [Pygmaiobacter massiliensis]|uniref:Mov34/MPN/PAD-1 family protein n=1 Tax=Pygmaiobacter massiliensis TaxID=1917873 RepID=UPI002A81064A|nr:Mov34/MPN/PAD-1 family protein [Pygmaiobacter massiliensis]MDY4784375.1 Mov34/MPN/PAD-1 family protein [Pygmaiobacter massiliensis]
MKESVNFHSKDERMYVSIPSSELNRMYQYCSNSNPYETGGILIGYYSSSCDTAVVTEVTGQPSNSKQTFTRFFRSSTNLVPLLNSRWPSGKYYLGEWHYHPNSSPMPSVIDERTIKACAINKRLKCPEPLLIIVGGNSTSGWKLYCGVVLNKNLISLSQD